MKNSYKNLILILILSLLFSACNSLNDPSPVSVTPHDTEIKTQQRASSLLNMSDLEVIKKSADYLNSIGKNLVFQETEILYMDNDNLSLIFKDSNDEDIHYKGSYLVIHFYPHAQSQEVNEVLTVYIGDHGRVLGYTSNPNSSIELNPSMLR